MELKHINSEKEFDEIIKEGNVVVDFFATWCGPCRMLGPILEEIQEERQDIKIVKLDVDLVSEVASRYRVASIPTLFFFQNGTLVSDHVGFVDKDALVEMIDKAFANQQFNF